jgi:hypothetical protein
MKVQRMTPFDVIEIVLERGPCFGCCPVFRFSALRHAGYRYHGQWFIEPLGERVGEFPADLFDRLAKMCVESKMLEWDDVYPSDFDDSPSTTVSVRYGEQVKAIRYEGGSASPLKLREIAQSIEVVMRHVLEREQGRG